MRFRAPGPWLIALVGASFLARTGLGWLRATPIFLPDEYIYATLGRSLADSGHPLIRGGSAHFPALLQPLVTAPAWLLGDVALAFRVVQTMGALAMSLAAVPVFLLARRLGLTANVALAVAALAELVPDLVYTSYISSEALAYPLTLTAIYAATGALTRPSRKAQLGFVAVAVLAMFARAQLAVLPLVFAAAVIVIGRRERRIRAALREQRLALGLFAIMTAAAVASGPTGLVGIYRWLFGFHARPFGIAHWAALDAMALAYAAGWIIVPGALIGLWLACWRPRSREEAAFGALTALMATALLLEVGFLQASLPVVDREIQERYLFYLIPLLGLCFALFASRGWPLRIPHLAIAAVLVVVAIRLPLSAYAVPATINGSPMLYGVSWLSERLGTLGDAAAAVAFAAGVMSVIAVLASRRPRLGTPIVLGLAILATGAASGAAIALDVDATRAGSSVLPRDRSWVDHAHVGRSVLLESWGGTRISTLQQLFWNRSIRTLALLPGGVPVDGFDAPGDRVAGDGSLFLDKRPLMSPLLVDEYASTVRLRGAHELERGPTASLWVPAGGPRLSLYATGRYSNGWLAGQGTIRIWPESQGRRLSGWLTMRLTAAIDATSNVITFRQPNDRIVRARLTPGEPRRVDIRVCSAGAWRTTYRAKAQRIVNLRLVSVRSSAPVFRPDPSACYAPKLKS